MKRSTHNIIYFALCWLFCLQIEANAGASVKQLVEQEAQAYIESLQNLKGQELLRLATKLQDAGINNKQILDKVEEVALEHHARFNADLKQETSYQITSRLARCLAGSGNTDYYPTLNLFMVDSKSRSLRNLSKTLMTRQYWYKQRNEIMNDFASHQPGHSLYTTRYLNLINHKDKTFGRYAAESLTRQERLDKVFLDRMAEIVKESYKAPGIGNQLDSLAWYIRVLGRSVGGEYRNLLLEIKNYSKLDKKLKKHVKKALKGQ